MKEAGIILNDPTKKVMRQRGTALHGAVGFLQEAELANARAVHGGRSPMQGGGGRVLRRTFLGAATARFSARTILLCRPGAQPHAHNENCRYYAMGR